jgi:mannose-6-phosphate isomerase-like protein (cupin superfamily)
VAIGGYYESASNHPAFGVTCASASLKQAMPRLTEQVDWIGRWFQ